MNILVSVYNNLIYFYLDCSDFIKNFIIYSLISCNKQAEVYKNTIGVIFAPPSSKHIGVVQSGVTFTI